MEHGLTVVTHPALRRTRRSTATTRSDAFNQDEPIAMTIRLRLTLWYTALLGMVLILFSVLVYSALANNLWAQVAQRLLARAE